jgi:hypothetical protein
MNILLDSVTSMHVMEYSVQPQIIQMVSTITIRLGGWATISDFHISSIVIVVKQISKITPMPDKAEEGMILIALVMEKHGGRELVHHHRDVGTVRHQVVTNR